MLSWPLPPDWLAGWRQLGALTQGRGGGGGEEAVRGNGYLLKQKRQHPLNSDVEDGGARNCFPPKGFPNLFVRRRLRRRGVGRTAPGAAGLLGVKPGTSRAGRDSRAAPSLTQRAAHASCLRREPDKLSHVFLPRQRIIPNRILSISEQRGGPNG